MLCFYKPAVFLFNLVKKTVLGNLFNFMEKNNQLIDESFTLKLIVWTLGK